MCSFIVESEIKMSKYKKTHSKLTDNAEKPIF